ncbi:MAG: hypothetical protein QOG49_1662, partial [Frankiaceae bacterium]|nr:hypothetical protein [Frankiaceae bacterium]
MRRLVCVPVLALLLAGCTKDHQTASRPPVSEVTTGSATAPSQSPSTSAGTPSVQPTSPAPLSSSAQPTSSAPPTPSAPLKQGKPRLEPVGDFQSPIYLTAPHGDHRLYVVEQAGVVRIVEGGQVRNQPFLDISADVKAGGEQGLLSIAFSPAYADDGH